MMVAHVKKRDQGWLKQQLKFHKNVAAGIGRMFVPDRPCFLRSPPAPQELTARVRPRDHDYDCFPS